MPEPMHRTETRESGLTTADLANLNESGSTTQELNQGYDSDQNRKYQDQNRNYQTGVADSGQREFGEGQPAGNAARRVDGKSNRADGAEDLFHIETAPLFSEEESKALRSRWDAIQVSFVDEPRQAVQQADSLVANAMKRLAEVFAEERGRLDQQWDRGGDVSTEDLRLALRRYRSFFGRILSV